MARKLRFGWFTFTCCEDNAIVFVELLNKYYFEWKEKVDFRYCKFIQSKNTLDEMDVAFVEGAVSNDHDKAKLLEVRDKAKYVVAVGSCACNGGPSAQRNDFSPEMKAKIAPFLKQWNLYETVVGIDKVVKVDDKVDGCPMFEQAFLKTLGKYIAMVESEGASGNGMGARAEAPPGKGAGSGSGQAQAGAAKGK